MAIRARPRHEEETQGGLQDHPEQGATATLVGGPFATPQEGGPLVMSAAESAGNGADHSSEQSGGEGTSTDQGKSKKPRELKAADFSRLGSVRVSAVIKALRPLENLANTSQYAWTEEQEKRIFDTLETKIKDIREMFAAARAPVIVDGKRKSNRQLLFRV